MDCIYLQYLKTDKEFFYTAIENCVINMHICNSHTANLAVTIALNNGSTGESISIYNKTMTAGETYDLTDIGLKQGMQIGGLAGTSSVVSIKLDLQ